MLQELYDKQVKTSIRECKGQMQNPTFYTPNVIDEEMKCIKKHLNDIDAEQKIQNSEIDTLKCGNFDNIKVADTLKVDKIESFSTGTVTFVDPVNIADLTVENFHIQCFCADDTKKFAGQDCNQWKDIINESCVADTCNFSGLSCTEWKDIIKTTCVDNTKNATCFDNKTYGQVCEDILSSIPPQPFSGEIDVYCGATCLCTINCENPLVLSENAFNEYAQISTETYPGAYCTGTVTSVNNISPVNGNVAIPLPPDLSSCPGLNCVGTVVESDIADFITMNDVDQCGYTTCKGTVTQVKVGTNEYNPTNGVISLPAYPPDLSSCPGLNCTGDVTTSQLNAVSNRVTSIEDKIPSQASSTNQLADKEFVNSSIETNTATFRGTFNSVADLEAYSGPKDNNDYAFVVTFNSATSSYQYDRYKYNETSWVFEYTINTTGFTAEQLAALNSGITCTLVEKITDVYNCKICIQKNNTCIDSFTLNQSSNKSINITVPTKTSDITNDCNFTSCTGTVTGITLNKCAFTGTGALSATIKPSLCYTSADRKLYTKLGNQTSSAVTLPSGINCTGTVTGVSLNGTSFTVNNGIASLTDFKPATAGTADNSICFNGCTYAQACANIRSGLCNHDCLVKLATVTTNADRAILQTGDGFTAGCICPVYFANVSGRALTYNAACGFLKIGPSVAKTSASVTASSGSLFGLGYMELSACTPYIDFHKDWACADYSARIINSAVGRLDILVNNATGCTASSSSKTFSFCNDGYMHGNVCGNLCGTANNSKLVCRYTINTGVQHVLLGANCNASANTCVRVSNGCPLTYDPATGILTTNIFCGEASFAKNSTCFGGKDYSTACTDIRTGLVTTTDLASCGYTTCKGTVTGVSLNGSSFTVKNGVATLTNFKPATASLADCATYIKRNATKADADCPLALLYTNTSAEIASLYVSCSCPITYNTCTGVLKSTKFNYNKGGETSRNIAYYQSKNYYGCRCTEMPICDFFKCLTACHNLAAGENLTVNYAWAEACNNIICWGTNSSINLSGGSVQVFANNYSKNLFDDNRGGWYSLVLKINPITGEEYSFRAYKGSNCATTTTYIYNGFSVNNARKSDSATNSTCFNGCTYANACTDIRNGLVTTTALASCGYTTCMGTLVPSDLNGYATETWVENKGYTTCTGTISSISLNGSAFTVKNGVASLTNFKPASASLADNSTCFGGCTYAQAKADIQCIFTKTYTASHNKYLKLGTLAISSGTVSSLSLLLTTFGYNDCFNSHNTLLEITSGTSSNALCVKGWTDVDLNCTCANCLSIIVTKDTTNSVWNIYACSSYTYQSYSLRRLKAFGTTTIDMVTDSAAVTGTVCFDSTSNNDKYKITYIKDSTINNATCFNGCTYAQACTNIRSGLCTHDCLVKHTAVTSDCFRNVLTAYSGAVSNSISPVSFSNYCPLQYNTNTGFLCAGTLCYDVHLTQYRFTTASNTNTSGWPVVRLLFDVTDWYNSPGTSSSNVKAQGINGNFKSYRYSGFGTAIDTDIYMYTNYGRGTSASWYTDTSRFRLEYKDKNENNVIPVLLNDTVNNKYWLALCFKGYNAIQYRFDGQSYPTTWDSTWLCTTSSAGALPTGWTLVREGSRVAKEYFKVNCGNTCLCSIYTNGGTLTLSPNAFNTNAQISTTTYPGACCVGTVTGVSLNGSAFTINNGVATLTNFKPATASLADCSTYVKRNVLASTVDAYYPLVLSNASTASNKASLYTPQASSVSYNAKSSTLKAYCFETEYIRSDNLDVGFAGQSTSVFINSCYCALDNTKVVREWIFCGKDGYLWGNICGNICGDAQNAKAISRHIACGKTTYDLLLTNGSSTADCTNVYVSSGGSNGTLKYDTGSKTLSVTNISACCVCTPNLVTDNLTVCCGLNFTKPICAAGACLCTSAYNCCYNTPIWPAIRTDSSIKGKCWEYVANGKCCTCVWRIAGVFGIQPMIICSKAKQCDVFAALIDTGVIDTQTGSYGITGNAWNYCVSTYCHYYIDNIYFGNDYMSFRTVNTERFRVYAECTSEVDWSTDFITFNRYGDLWFH